MFAVTSLKKLQQMIVTYFWNTKELTSKHRNVFQELTRQNTQTNKSQKQITQTIGMAWVALSYGWSIESDPSGGLDPGGGRRRAAYPKESQRCV